MTRSPEGCKADPLAKLTAVDVNVRLASAFPTGAVHLVPVSHTWNGNQIVLTTEPGSRTVAQRHRRPASPPQIPHLAQVD